MAKENQPRPSNSRSDLPDELTTSTYLTASELNLPTLSVLIQDVGDLSRYRPKEIVRLDDEPDESVQDQSTSSETEGAAGWARVLNLVGLVKDYPLAEPKPINESEHHWTVAAKHVESDRSVVVKISKREVTGALSELFASAAKRTAKLKHPNIPEILFCGKLKGSLPYFVTAFIEGYTLEELRPGLHLSGDAIDWRTGSGAAVLRYICDAAIAVSLAHSQGVTHGKLSASSLRVCKATKAIKVLDWGLLPSVSGIDGKVMPTVTSNEDLKRLGATLFEVVCNTANVSRQDSDILDLLSQKPIASELDAIVMKCMQLDSSNGYESVQAFSDDINRYLARKPVLAFEEKLAGLSRSKYRIGLIWSQLLSGRKKPKTTP